MNLIAVTKVPQLGISDSECGTADTFTGALCSESGSGNVLSSALYVASDLPAPQKADSMLNPDSTSSDAENSQFDQELGDG